VRFEFTERMYQAGQSEGVYGIGEDWRFDNPPSLVWLGWQMWRACKFARMPTRQEVEDMEGDWVSDLMLAQQIYEWRNNDKMPTKPKTNGKTP
jgi:hypothetical protein